MKIVNDISFWQVTADFEVMKTKSAGVILRAGQGSWRDSKFDTFRTSAKSANMPFGNYFYYDNQYPPKRQAENWARIIGDDEGVLGSWLDIEDSNPGPFIGYKNWWDCVTYFKQLVPNSVLGIYTRASYFNTSIYGVPANHAFRNLPLWVAHYGADKPTLPKGWDSWLMWQFTSSGDGTGFGVGSKEIDCNYYGGELVKSHNRLIAHFDGKDVEYVG